MRAFLFRVLLALVVLAIAGLFAFAFLGDLDADRAPVAVPITLDDG